MNEKESGTSMKVFEKARRSMSAGDFAEAAELFDKTRSALEGDEGLARERLRGQAMFERGMCLRKLGRVAAAMDQFREIVESFGERREFAHFELVARALNVLGHRHETLGDTAEAQACWKEVISRYRREKAPGLTRHVANAYRRLARAREREDDSPLALKTWMYYEKFSEKLAHGRPSIEEARALEGKARCHLEREDLEEAEAAFQMLLLKFEDHPDDHVEEILLRAMEALTDLLMRRDFYERCLPLQEWWIREMGHMTGPQADRTMVRARMTRAACLKLLGRHADAIGQVEAVLADLAADKTEIMPHLTIRAVEQYVEILEELEEDDAICEVLFNLSEALAPVEDEVHGGRLMPLARSMTYLRRLGRYDEALDVITLLATLRGRGRPRNHVFWEAWQQFGRMLPEAAFSETGPASPAFWDRAIPAIAEHVDDRCGDPDMPLNLSLALHARGEIRESDLWFRRFLREVSPGDLDEVMKQLKELRIDEEVKDRFKARIAEAMFDRLVEGNRAPRGRRRNNRD